MRDIDEYMRGTGRMVRQGHAPLWGPGRHSSGDNVYSYFAGPDDFVVEYTTALERIGDEDAWVPRVWLAGRSTPTAGARPGPVRTCSRCGTALPPSRACGSRPPSERTV